MIVRGAKFTIGEQIILQTQKAYGGALVPLVSVTIIGQDRLKTRAWKAEYSVRDDRGLYLAKGGRFTRSPSESIDPQASVEDEATLRRYAAQGKLARAERRERSIEAQRAQERAFNAELKAVMSGLEPAHQIILLSGLKRHLQETATREAA